MPVVSAPDLALQRTDRQHSEMRVSFLRPPTLWSARIDDGTIVKGETSIDFDAGAGTDFALIEAIQEVWVGTAAGDVDVGRLRIKGISSGDGGVTGTVTVSGHSLPLADDQYLTFKHDYPLKPKFSYVDPANNDIWYMDDDIVFNVDYRDEPTPVTIAGNHRAGFLSSGTWVINVDASDSYVMATGAAISSYALTVASTAGAPVVVFNGGLGTGTITFSAAGYYWAKYTSTDDNGQSQITYRCYIVHDPDPSAGDYPFISCKQITLENDWSGGGWTAGLLADSEYSLDDIPDHTLAIVWGSNWWDATEQNITFLPDDDSANFVGYVRRDQQAMDWAEEVGEVDLVMSTIEGRLKRLFSFSTSLIAQQNPANWWEGKTDQRVGDIIHDLWLWRSTLFNVCDVIGLADNSLLRMFGALDEGNLFDMANTFMYDEGIRTKAICDQGGRIHITEDQQLLNDTDRAALTNMFKIQKTAGAADYGGVFSVPRRQENEVPFVTANGFYWDGGYDASGTPQADDFCSIAPGGKPLWDGPNPMDKPKQTISSQNHLNQISGRYLARENNEFEEVRIEFRGNYVGILDAAYSETYTIDLQTADTPREIVWADKPLYLRHVQAVYISGNPGGAWRVEASFEPEADGWDGETTDCPSFPALGGETPATPDEDDVPGALLSGASVNFKPANLGSWSQRVAAAVSDLFPDPFWRSKTGSTAPSGAIVYRCGVGYVRRSTDAFDTTDVDVTPGDPPNTAGDAPAPTVGNVEFIMGEGSVTTSNVFMVLARWQNGTGDWRSWIAYTADNGTTWVWKYLGATAGGVCADPGAANAITGVPPNPIESYFAPGVASDDRRTMVNLNANVFVFTYFDTITFSWYVQAVDTSTWSFGARVALPAFAGTSAASIAGICRVNNTKFIVSDGVSTYVGSLAVLAITLGANQSFIGTAVPNYFVVGWGSSGMFVCPDGTNVVAFTRAGHIDGACNSSSPPTYKHWVVDGVVAGLSITWSDTTCGGATYRDLTLVDSDTVSSLFSSGGVIDLIDMGDGSTWLASFLHRDADGLHVYVVAGSGTSFGTPVRVDSVGCTRHKLVRLGTTTAALVYSDYYDAGPPASEDLIAKKISLVGWAISLGTESTLWAPGDNYPIVINATFDIDSDEFAVDFIPFGATCSTHMVCKVLGSNITVTHSCDEFASFTQALGAGDGASNWIIVECDTITPSMRHVDKSDVSTCLTGTDSQGLGLSMGKGVGNRAWVTHYDGTDLGLLEISIPGMVIENRFDLGAATQNEVNLDTYTARPYVPYGFEDVVYIGGRMQDPQSLADPAHVIRYNTGVWELIEDGWGVDHVGALILTTSNILYAIRNSTGKSKLYVDNADNNLLLKLTMFFATQVAWHGMAVDFITGDVYVGAATGYFSMVSKIASPYITESNLTFDHDTANGIVSIVLL